MAPPAKLALLGLLALPLAGCAIIDPYTQPQPSASATTAELGAQAPEPEGPPPPAPGILAPGAAKPTPQAALERYAWLYVNWSAASLPDDQRQLASISTGQARAQAQHEGGVSLPLLREYAVSNSGEVVAIAPGQGSEGGRWAVITNEQTSGDGPYQGLPATSHVTWATVAHFGRGWVVSGWYPAT